MKECLKWVNEMKIKRTIKALENNNIDSYYVKDREQLINKIEQLVEKNSVVTCGGSVTLMETGVLDYLRKGSYKFLDRYVEGLTQQEIKQIYRAAFSADAYFTSSNAITEDGELFNVDGNGNRVAAMLYGPDKVIIIAGVNKIVPDLECAIERNRKIAAPANAKRLNKKTPCAKLGYCMECSSEDRICLEYTLIRKQRAKGRIHVIFLDENLGY